VYNDGRSANALRLAVWHAPDKKEIALAEPIETMGTNTKRLCFQRVGIFVDAENIELSGLKHMEGFTNYKKILDSVGDREIIRILYYKPEYKDISADFESFWASLGGEIRRPAKNADTFLVIDAVTMSDKMDVAIILGGDKDFLPLIWYLKSRGCRTEIWSWPQATSKEVMEAVDRYYPLDEEFLLDDEKKKGPRKKRNQLKG
jgi:uncharacterized LabA/DUF88 family protein